MLNIFKKRTKLTSHEKAITVMHLNIRKNQLQKDIDDNHKEDNWCTEHDIRCLENAILYLESH